MSRKKTIEEQATESEISITLEEYIERFMMILSKDGKLIHLKMNDAQRRLYDVFKEHYNNDQPCKIIILKARQMGFSTMTEAIISAIAMTHYYTTALIMAHDPDSTAHIYGMTKRFYDNLPAQLKPMQKYSNARQLTFENPSTDARERDKNPGLRSSVRVATAGQYGVGRGSTFQYMHLSELAFWKEQDGKTVQDQLTGLLQTLPQSGSSLLVIESTANGYNYFKSLWDQAEKGENEFIPLFFPWFQMKEYRRAYHGEQLTAEEEELKDKFSLDNQQIMWRRYAISTLCGNDINKFKQEYPSTPEEAFILTGNPFFDTGRIMQRMGHLPTPIKRGSFTEKGNWYDDDKGYIQIWEEPQPNHLYSIGCDTAGEGSDYFVSYVLDKTNGGRMVAKYRAQMSETVFVNQMFYLGATYGWAMIAPEVNFSTYPVIALQDKGYPNLYVRELADTYTGRMKKSFGFRTTQITRPLILDALKAIVNSDDIEKIVDRDFFDEALTFIKNENGKPEASSGSHDDCVMACAISYHTMAQAGQPNMMSYDDDDDMTEEDIEANSFMHYGE